MLNEGFAERYLLGIPQIDTIHGEFIELLNRLDGTDKAGFIGLFPQLLEQTKGHFEIENALMSDFRFPAIREHMEEHQRVLGDLDRLAERVRNGYVLMARAYVREQLPQWFSLHAVSMDNALAAYLKNHKQVVPSTSN